MTTSVPPSPRVADRDPDDHRVPATPARGLDEIRARHIEALGLFGTVGDPRFRAVTDLAQRVLDVPIAAVTLVADDTVWFAAATGFDVPSVPRTGTFCDVTVTRSELVVVPDTLADPDYAWFPSVVGPPHIRAYAGAPLTDESGVTVGTFCVYDTAPRTFSEAELVALASFAAWAQRELVASVDTERARSAQQALLPSRAVTLPGVSVVGLCTPVGAVGGDFYDWGVVNGTLAFSLIDVMGKGTAAALLAATVRALLRATTMSAAVHEQLGAVGGGVDLGAIVWRVDALARGDLDRAGSLVTGFLGRYDPADGTLTYVDAGHGLAVVVRADGSATWLRSTDMPLGVDPSARWHEREVVLGPGDTLLCCSDGLFDVFGGTGEALQRIELLVRACETPAQVVAQVQRLARVRSAVDDVTAVVLMRDRPERDVPSGS